jgi:hypothetical protein
MFHIDWLAIIVATAASAALGAAWFLALFPKIYAQALGKAGEKMPNTPIFMVGPMLCNLVTAIAIAMLLALLGPQDFAQSVRLGLLIGVGFLAATTVNTGINPNIPRPLLYGLVSGSYFLAAGVVMTVIIAAMQ